MNRKERRHMEKQLGITKKKQKLTVNQRLKETRKNIEAGRKKDGEMKEARRRQENEAADKAAAHRVSSLAVTLLVKHGLSWYEALKAAKLQIEADDAEKAEKAEKESQ